MRLLPLAPSARHYVALGDILSMDAFVGEPGRGAASLLLRNRDDEFPAWVGRDLSSHWADLRLIPLAAPTATAAHVRFVQLPRLAEMPVLPVAMTLSMGGEDLLQSLGEEDFAAAAQKAFDRHAREVLATLRRRYGDAVPIALAPVPTPGAPSPWTDVFNQTLEQLAYAYGAQVGVCGTIEPNARGASALRAAFWRCFFP